MEGLLKLVGLAVLGAALVVGLSAILLWAYPSLRTKMNSVLLRALATVAAGLYAVSPIDFIPDFIPVLGQLDDLTVIVLLILYWMALFKNPSAQLNKRPSSDQVIDIKPVD